MKSSIFLYSIMCHIRNTSSVLLPQINITHTNIVITLAITTGLSGVVPCFLYLISSRTRSREVPNYFFTKERIGPDTSFTLHSFDDIDFFPLTLHNISRPCCTHFKLCWGLFSRGQHQQVYAHHIHSVLKQIPSEFSIMWVSLIASSLTLLYTTIVLLHGMIQRDLESFESFNPNSWDLLGSRIF